MDVFYHVVLFVLLIVATQCEEHLHANGPFGKAHLSAEIPNCNQISGIFFRSIRSASVSISELKVSSTNYSNANTIYVTWTPLTTPCKDDFIGVYFLEIPVETGKK